MEINKLLRCVAKTIEMDHYAAVAKPRFELMTGCLIVNPGSIEDRSSDVKEFSSDDFRVSVSQAPVFVCIVGCSYVSATLSSLAC